VARELTCVLCSNDLPRRVLVKLQNGNVDRLRCHAGIATSIPTVRNRRHSNVFFILGRRCDVTSSQAQKQCVQPLRNGLAQYRPSDGAPPGSSPIFTSLSEGFGEVRGACIRAGKLSIACLKVACSLLKAQSTAPLVLTVRGLAGRRANPPRASRTMVTSCAEPQRPAGR
jgi:hypothetical protein